MDPDCFDDETDDITCDTTEEGEEHSSTENDASEEISQLMEFHHLVDPISKGKRVISIENHPINSNIVAISLCTHSSFEERLWKSIDEQQSHLLMYDIKQHISPLLAILKSPVECPVFRFNPTMPKLAVGGLVNGEVALFQIPSELSNSMKPPFDNHISPDVISSPESSHRQMVSDIFWLPPGIQLNSKGRLVQESHLTDVSHQFISCSCDGIILVWDVRARDIAMGKLPFIARPKQLMKKDDKSLKWVPIFRVRVKHFDSSSAIPLCKMMKKSLEDGNLLCSATSGDLVSVKMLADVVTSTPFSDGERARPETAQIDATREVVNWIRRDHYRPALTLEQSPFLPELFVSVGDSNFNIWSRTCEDEPVFSSPNMYIAKYTGGKWSPTRAGILYLSTTDGKVQIWNFEEGDLIKPSMICSVAALSIETMEYIVCNDKEHFLVIGDSNGSLRVVAVPISFVTEATTSTDTIRSNFVSASCLSS